MFLKAPDGRIGFERLAELDKKPSQKELHAQYEASKVNLEAAINKARAADKAMKIRVVLTLVLFGIFISLLIDSHPYIGLAVLIVGCTDYIVFTIRDKRNQ